MEYAIITGVSQGLGASVASLILESKINVIGISRNNLVDILTKESTIENGRIYQATDFL